MPKLLTQEEAKRKSLLVNIKIVGPYILANTKTQFQCPFCNIIFDAVPNHIWRKEIKSCGCYNKRVLASRSWKGTKDISKDYFSTIKRGAKQRNLEFNITQEYIQELLEKQDYKCALSGLKIECTRSQKKIKSTYKNQTASLDRIDSSKGYIQNNVQWTHKDINMMKRNFPEDLFIQYCKTIANYHTNFS